MNPPESFRTPFRLNRYPAPCVGCGERVPAKAGSLMGRNEYGRWIVAHNRCIPDEQYSAAAEAAQAAFDNPQQ
jgi:hypothetical protein